MKAAIIGYSGSGKSTLARTMAACYGIAALHLDQVFWLPGWQERNICEADQLVHGFLNTHTDWVIDGNYSGMAFDRRMQEADQIIILAFPRLTCLLRAWRRYRKNRGTSRGDMAEGCPDKMDWTFVRWILWDGRDAKHRRFYADVLENHGNKCIVLKNQRELTKFPSGLNKKYAAM